MNLTLLTQLPWEEILGVGKKVEKYIDIKDAVELDWTWTCKEG